jgi:hypothetical protein
MSNQTTKPSEFAFIPRPLILADRPDLEVFPLNIMFMNLANIDGVDTCATAIYEPFLPSHINDDITKSMRYYNTRREEDYIDIRYDPITGKYEGDKYINNKPVHSAYGPAWKGFFIHLTIGGLNIGEACLFEPMIKKDKE